MKKNAQNTATMMRVRRYMVLPLANELNHPPARKRNMTLQTLARVEQFQNKAKAYFLPEARCCRKN